MRTGEYSGDGLYVVVCSSGAEQQGSRGREEARTADIRHCVCPLSTLSETDQSLNPANLPAVVTLP